jgi:hypothetical protein
VIENLLDYVKSSFEEDDIGCNVEERTSSVIMDSENESADNGAFVQGNKVGPADPCEDNVENGESFGVPIPVVDMTDLIQVKQEITSAFIACGTDTTKQLFQSAESDDVFNVHPTEFLNFESSIIPDGTETIGRRKLLNEHPADRREMLTLHTVISLVFKKTHLVKGLRHHGYLKSLFSRGKKFTSRTVQRILLHVSASFQDVTGAERSFSEKSDLDLGDFFCVAHPSYLLDEKLLYDPSFDQSVQCHWSTVTCGKVIGKRNLKDSRRHHDANLHNPKFLIFCKRCSYVTNALTMVQKHSNSHKKFPVPILCKNYNSCFQLYCGKESDKTLAYHE